MKIHFFAKIATALAVLLIAGLAVSQTRQIRRNENVGQAQRRLALVIGDDSYPAMPLRNARNDAQAIRSALKEAGFSVDYAEDTTLQTLARTIDQFSAKLQSGDVALFYYAGHGISLDGKNYLIPVDFSANSEADVEYAAYAANRVQKKLEERGSRLNVLILDACRDNPFKFGRSAAGGLAAMREGVGTLIAFAAAEGQKKASDNPGASNGLFTKHLLAELKEPGVPLRELFFKVQSLVYEESQKKQFPYIYAGVVGEFYFLPPKENGPGITTAAPAPAPSLSPDLQVQTELAFWNSVDKGSAEAFQLYLEKYPKGQFAELARLNLEKLRKTAAGRPKSPASPRYRLGHSRRQAN